MEAKVTFMYENKSYQVSCSPKEEMSSLFQKFIKEINPKSNINDYKFYYEGEILLNHTAKLEEALPLKDEKPTTISVKKQLRILKCSKCNYNDCIIDLKNFRLALYGCEHNHSFSFSYDDYAETQRMEPSKIRCCTNLCKNNQENDTKNFYLCLTCS